MGVIFLFLLALAAGSLTTLFWIPEEQMGRGYFQMNALVVLGLIGLATAIAALHPVRPFGEEVEAGMTALGLALAAAFAYYGAIWQERWRLGRWPLTAALVATSAALWLAGRRLVDSDTALPHLDLLLGASLLTSALLLGWALITMLLGHWYLIAPKLTFRHLVLFCWVLLGTIVLRGLAIGASLTTAAGVDDALGPTSFQRLVAFSGQGMFFWVRLLWGLGVPLLLGLMSLHCARNNSNQSATGILYVLVVGCIIGELSAYYLMTATGVPV